MTAQTGLIIGKFMPPHAGHLRLIAAAQRQVAELSLVLFSKADEPIPGALRLAWLRELLPGVSVYPIGLEHRVDFDDREAWDFWTGAIRMVLPRSPEVVFSSEAYGDELARRLGARHVLVDAARREVPISATQIRHAPLAHWDFIPPPVRPYFVRRVAILGAESTGKTTLAQALAAHFHTVWAPEYAREFLLHVGRPPSPADLLHIAREQAASEERLARQANRLLVGDTNVLTTQVWYEHYFGECPPELRRLASHQAAHLYLLCGLDVPWAADGLRDSPEHRPWFHDRFLRELETRGWPYLVLSGSSARRQAAAVAGIEALLSEPSGPALALAGARAD